MTLKKEKEKKESRFSWFGYIVYNIIKGFLFMLYWDMGSGTN